MTARKVPVRSSLTFKEAIDGVGYVVAGILILGLPLVWGVLFALSSLAIARDSATLWYTTAWLLVGSTWLLFCRKANAETRIIVEFTIWLASIALFLAVLIAT